MASLTIGFSRLILVGGYPYLIHFYGWVTVHCLFIPLLSVGSFVDGHVGCSRFVDVSTRAVHGPSVRVGL